MVYVVTIGTLAAGSEAGLGDAVERLLVNSMAESPVVSATMPAKLLATESDGSAGAVGVVSAEESRELEAKVEADGISDAELDGDEDDEPSAQLRLYKGVLLNVVPTRPKLGLGAVGTASCTKKP